MNEYVENLALAAISNQQAAVVTGVLLKIAISGAPEYEGDRGFEILGDMCLEISRAVDQKLG